jgi:hypothetical protein
VALAEQVWEKKSFPFENAANVKYPLISTSAIQFAARAMPEFIKPVAWRSCSTSCRT